LTNDKELVFQLVNLDELVTSQKWDGKLKTSKCKACELACWQAGLEE